jgi:hypothetical protein
MPRHLAVLVEQLETQKQADCTIWFGHVNEEQGGASCIYQGGIGSITIR